MEINLEVGAEEVGWVHKFLWSGINHRQTYRLKKLSAAAKIDEDFERKGEGKIMTVLKLTERLYFFESTMMVLKNIDLDLQNVETNTKSWESFSTVTESF